MPTGLADESVAGELVRLAQLRNAVAQRYLDYKRESVRWFLHSGCRAVQGWLTSCERLVTDAEGPAPSARSPGT